VWPIVGPSQYASAPTSSDLNSHPELSAWRSQYSNRPLDINVPVKHKLCGAEISPPRLAYDISTSKWDHRSPVSWDYFLPIFSFLRPSVLELGSGTGQTDGRTVSKSFIQLVSNIK